MFGVHCLLLFIHLVKSDKLDISINANISICRHFPHFWKSTGFCPPDPKNEIQSFLLSKDEEINLALIGALPYKGIKWVRVHWLLNLISLDRSSVFPYKYNFTNLDLFMDLLKANKLNPGFELMGIPNGIQLNTNDNIYLFWYTLVKTLARRYVDRYGARDVRKWRFETWNEPDLKSYNILNFTLPEYLLYENGCNAGLRDALSMETTAKVRNKNNALLKLGGPAGLFKSTKHPLCWGALERCNEMGDSCPLQFISFHKKGDGIADNVLVKDLELLDLIHFKYPNIRHIPIANDEADVQVNWSKDEDWRGDARYPAMAVKIVVDHFLKLILERKVKMEVLSFDNAFLNYHPFYFSQRTLLARFQMNNTIPEHVQFIKKPIYSVMGLLSLLGEENIDMRTNISDRHITLLATRSKTYKTTSLVIACGNDSSNSILTLNVFVYNLQDQNTKYVVFVINNQLTNPFFKWRDVGSPSFPNKAERKSMRNVEVRMIVL